MLGTTNNLEVLKQVDFGMYLDGGDLGEILIPKRYVPHDLEVGDTLEVFIYRDSDDRIIATTETPYAEISKSAHMRVVGTNDAGAFLDWGLSKDLFVPFKEQRTPMREGNSYTVYVFIDKSDRIAGSSKLSLFLKETDDDGIFIEGQMVNLQIASRSDLGFKAIINDTHLGLIHHSDLLQPIKVGTRAEGYIKNIRDDGKIDLTLQAKGESAIDSLAKDILEFIKEEGGVINITDKSSPDIIYKTFAVSKASYKKALGQLYREKLVLLSKGEVRLV